MDPRTLQMLRRMGIRAEQIPVKRVVFEMDGETWIFENPVVIETSMGGQRAYQIMGEPRREQGVSEEDVEILMERTGKSREEVIEALKKAKGDLAEALSLLEGK